MSVYDFVFGNAPTPGSDKADLEALPGGADPINYLSGAEWNRAIAVFHALRAADISGSYQGYVTSSADPNVQAGLSGTNAWEWAGTDYLPRWSYSGSNGVVQTRILTSGALAEPSALTASVGLFYADITVGRRATVGIVTGSGGVYSGQDLGVARNTYVVGRIGVGADRKSPAGLIEVRGSGSVEELILDRTANAGANTILRLRRQGSNVAFLGIDSADLLTLGRGAVGLTISDNAVTASVGVLPGSATSLDLGKSGLAWQSVYTSDVRSPAGGLRASLWEDRAIVTGSLTASLGLMSSLDIETIRNLTVGGRANFTQDITGSEGAQFSRAIIVGTDPASTYHNSYALVAASSKNIGTLGGQMIITQATPSTSIIISAVAVSTAVLYHNNTTQPFYLGAGSSAPNNTKHVVLIPTNGNTVGIGTSTVTAKLHVSGTSTTEGICVQVDGPFWHSRHDGTYAIFGHQPVAQESGYTLNGGIRYKNLGSGSVLAQVEGFVRQLASRMIALGHITGTV
jgi:hypothetical protein